LDIFHSFYRKSVSNEIVLRETVMASRGCPYRCSFCSVSRMFGQKVRRRSVDKVYKDIRSYVEQGFREFFFYDDNFTSNRDWTRELMGRIRPLDVRIWAQTRVDFPWLDRSQRLFDRTLLDAMRRAGVSTLYIGYETIDDSTASQWHKGYRGQGVLRERLLEDTRILHDSGFWIHGMFVVGPQHTDKTVDQIVEFSRQAKLESMHLSILTPLPGTPLFEEMRSHLIFTDFPEDWDYYDGGHCVYEHSRLGVQRLQETVLSAHRRFYRGYSWSPRRIRDVLGGRAPLIDRLRWVWSTARVAQRTFKEWEQETRMFLEVVRAKRAASPGAPQATLPSLTL
jgi:pyruvate-formate lyase-activating enzyme